MKTKRETTYLNIFAIFFVQFIMTALGGYVNAQMPFLLESDSYFAIDRTLAGNRNSKLLIASDLAVCVILPFIGYMYDLIGRRKVLITSSFCLGIERQVWLLTQFYSVDF